MHRTLRKIFFQNKRTLLIAKSLLGKFLVRRFSGHEKAYMITEVEAYDGPFDKASHAHRGRTSRNAPMFDEAGRWYIYLTYGVHWMLNIVTGPKDYPAAVLIRGALSNPISKCLSGPGRLTKNLIIDKKFNNQIASKQTGLWVEDRGIFISPKSIQQSQRIGVAYAGEWSLKPYRFYIKSLTLSRKNSIAILQTGGVGVIPTDTIYGIVGLARDKENVERIYALRRRDKKKPLIVLISSLADLKLFGINTSSVVVGALQKMWPDRVSVILPCKSKRFEYLHRGTKTLAFRMPDDAKLREILKQTGPLVAPSANWEGHRPATTIAEAKKYFGDKVDFYIDGGKMKSLPSTLIVIDKEGNIEVKRQGVVRFYK